MSLITTQVHMIVECLAMAGYRNTCNLGQHIAMYRRLQPQISSAKLYSLYLNDSVRCDLREDISIMAGTL